MAEKKTWCDHEGEVCDSVKGFDVIDCSKCGFKHIVPIPSAEELEEVYRHEYYTSEKPLYLERYREDLDWWNLVYGDRYDTFEELLPQKRRRILDIGSGPGFFLKHGKDRGWETVGIEPSARAAAHSREMGLDIIEEFFSTDTAIQLGLFDVIHMSAVLEHIPDPEHFLGIVRKNLTPEGILCVVVPNDYNPFQLALRTACNFQPWWVAPPHHINFFDFESLEHLLTRSGFEVTCKESTFPIDLFLLMGDNYIGNDTRGRACHAKRMQFETNLAAAGLTSVKRSLYQSLANLNIGREVCLYSRRTD
ncbi:Methyltransferase type 12 [Geobacter metallireducens RCH3]|uniref:SAM-dependent methyltransferase, putative n=1 Tax=Geobacter metallireducens (strain ATCC 53774 / DSM 7210 / GS-15) TaxID=269799 RepID=Q39YH8_GEOMG|nr:class I SAM-dependent methyltransferase [Geobacter metallireducens]ABB30696.1 SAM-dependent methyltransferase, putative [Geobacter metallireducens GS-15]EHP85502.1 Methyltransferase type 12 [Geobacter metallireducens RCH3]